MSRPTRWQCTSSRVAKRRVRRRSLARIERGLRSSSAWNPRLGGVRHCASPCRRVGRHRRWSVPRTILRTPPGASANRVAFRTAGRVDTRPSGSAARSSPSADPSRKGPLLTTARVRHVASARKRRIRCTTEQDGSASSVLRPGRASFPADTPIRGCCRCQFPFRFRPVVGEPRSRKAAPRNPESSTVRISSVPSQARALT